MFKYTLGIIVLACAVVGVSLFAMQQKKVGDSGTKQELLYRNEKYGIEFIYPGGYVINESEVGNGERGHYAILLTEESVTRVENGEGPTGITIDIYQNNIDTLSVKDWILGTNDSNFKLSQNQVVASTTIAGVSGFSYEWSGLYEAKTAVIVHRDNIAAFTVTRITPQDEILKTFDKVLASLKVF